MQNIAVLEAGDGIAELRKLATRCYAKTTRQRVNETTSRAVAAKSQQPRADS